MLRKQGMNTWVVGVNDSAPHIFWTNYFIESQGYKTYQTLVYQDNHSSIFLETNGKKYSSKRNRYMNIP